MSTHPLSEIRAILFDVVGSVVDWRTSLITDLTAWSAARGWTADWAGLVDDWRGAYAPSMDRVRKGELPWTILDELHRSTLADLARKYGLPNLSDAELDHINRGWHRLQPWPDSVAGLARLKTRYIIGPLSNGNVALLVNMAKGAGLPWDVICSTELFAHYKPDPETYLGAAKLLGLAPQQVMLAAAHNNDLAAARACGLATAFFPRPSEYGPRQVRDYAADQAWDVVAADIGDLASRMGC